MINQLTETHVLHFCWTEKVASLQNLTVQNPVYAEARIHRLEVGSVPRSLGAVTHKWVRKEDHLRPCLKVVGMSFEAVVQPVQTPVSDLMQNPQE